LTVGFLIMYTNIHRKTRLPELSKVNLRIKLMQESQDKQVLGSGTTV
jgi:hypothetical protein